MSINHHPRPAPCSHCGDVVLVGERTPRLLFGRPMGKAGPTVWLEHADPAPDGELFDPVDDDCRRPWVG